MGAALALSLFGGAAVAQAATLTSDQVSAITNLLQAFGVDSGTIAGVQAILTNQPAATFSSSGSVSPGTSGQSGGNNCDVLDNNLQLGATDGSTKGDVSQLQEFLAKNKDIYPEGAVTGYFGSSTKQAVERWQAAHGIVSSGDSESTGYGHVGPRTRGEMDKEMETECEQDDAHGSSSGDN